MEQEETPAEIAKRIHDGMEGIGGIPTRKEYLAEFAFRFKAALGIEEETKPEQGELPTDEEIRTEKELRRSVHIAIEGEPSNVMKGIFEGFELGAQWMRDQLKGTQPEQEESNIIDHISQMKDDSGREGCTYGDTEYDSLSVVYGYNLTIDHIVQWLKERSK